MKNQLSKTGTFHFYQRGIAAFLLTALAALCLAPSIQAQEKKAAPKIAFDSKDKDFGKIEEGKDKDFAYTIKNVGTANLRIFRLNSPCGCIELKMKQKVIPPGGSVQLEGKFITKGRIGKQDKAIFVYSNDPTTPISSLKCKLLIESGVRVDPRSVSFGEIKPKSKLTRKLTIESHLEHALKIKKITVVGADAVSCKMSRPKSKSLNLPNGKKGYLTTIVVELKVNVKKLKGDISGKLEIETNSVKSPKITVLISGEKTGDLKVTPALVLFRNVAPGQSSTSKVTVSGIKKGNFNVLGVDAGDFPVKLKAKTQKAAQEQEVELVFTAPAKDFKPFYRGYIYFLTNHPTQQRVKVGFNATIQRQPSKGTDR